MVRTLIIWGAGGHALVVADVVRQQGHYRVLGFLDDVSPGRAREEFGGATVLGGREQLDTVRDLPGLHVILGFGDCEARLRLAEVVRAKGLPLARAIHPDATLARDVTVGHGSVVAAGAVINPGAVIGENVIINTSASIDHECIIGDGVHVGPGAHLAGRVAVGRGTMIGVGAAIITGVQIGAGSIVGAGAVVLRDVPGGVVCYGNPARVIRDIRAGDFGRV